MSTAGRQLPWRAAVTGLLAVGLLAIAACGNDDDGNGEGNGEEPAATVGDLRIYDPVVRYTFSPNAAGYFRIENTGDEDRLIGVRTSITDRAELHEVIQVGDTGGRMQQVEGGIIVPASGELTLQTGGYHVMVMGLERELEHGEAVEFELEFEQAGSVTLIATVEVLGGAQDDGHAPDNGDEGQDHQDGGSAY